ncbi:MAG: DoxX family protein [Bacteroidales bacterium]|nr:DoxX family protein [Bacteroidales bacterium]
MSDLSFSSGKQKAGMTVLTILRVGIGWHFLYEGFAKLIDPTWTAAGYLSSATGPFAGIFRAMAENDLLLQVINVLNIWGLIFIGLGLFLGLFTRIAQLAGILLLGIFYLSHPPVFSDPGFFREGSYFFVSKDLIEILALVTLMFFPTGRFLGLDALMMRSFRQKAHKMDHGQPDTEEHRADVGSIERREVLKHLATVPFLGAMAYGVIRKSRMESMEEQNLVDASAGPTQRFVQQMQAGSNQLALDELKGTTFNEIQDVQGQLPKGLLGTLESSKLILGGNLLSGYVHSRDLIYVSKLVQNYHQKDRVFKTLMMAEQAGVNTLLSNPVVMPLMEEYWKEGYGDIQFISDCAGLIYWPELKPMPFDEYENIVKSAIDSGIHAGYIQGETADYYIENNEVDKIVHIMDLLRKNGLPAGIGAHKIETIKKCVELGLETDFWMKTLHSHDYWSARHPTWHDNIYCFDPDETVQFMESLPEPWIAFKTLAAGALHPDKAFPYAFERGADFLCVGMYDFQIVDDVNIALNTLDNISNRRRPWRA